MDFTSPINSTYLFVNQSENVTFEWRYEIGDAQPTYRLRCGYRYPIQEWIVAIDGDSSAQVKPKFQSKVEVMNTTNNRIGFMLKNCQFADVGDIGCQMIYNNFPHYSQLYYLQIYGECVHFLTLPSSI